MVLILVARRSSSRAAKCRTTQITTGSKLAQVPRCSLHPTRVLSRPLRRVLKATDGKSVALSAYEGKKPVVLFFYPRVRNHIHQTPLPARMHRMQPPQECVLQWHMSTDSAGSIMQAATPGCTKEACAFRDAYGKFKDAGAEVFGISSDSVDANSDFAKVGG